MNETGATYCFGYGSLVNRDTHGYQVCYPAVVRGWSRVWSHWVNSPMGEVTSLTVRPDPAGEVRGLIMATPAETHAALDARERGYDRHQVAAGEIDHGGPTGVTVELYQSRRQQPGSAAAPILLSYVDAVMAGFLREYGWDGVAEFVATTSGWEAPILKDRADPRYPRAVAVSADVRDRFDAMLDDRQVTWISG